MHAAMSAVRPAERIRQSPQTFPIGYVYMDAGQYNKFFSAVDTVHILANQFEVQLYGCWKLTGMQMLDFTLIPVVVFSVLSLTVAIVLYFYTTLSTFQISHGQLV